MKGILTFFALFFLCSLSAQVNNIYANAGIAVTVGAPTFKPGAKGSIVAIDSVTGTWYVSRDRYAANGNWLSMGDRIESISGCSAPLYTPNKYNSDLVINNCGAPSYITDFPKLYQHIGGGVWVCLNCPTGTTYTAGTGIDVTGTVITNTAPDQTVAITGGGINSVSGTYPSFTVTGTEVDGSTSNELQTLSVGSGTTTLSNSGGSMTIAGAGINSVGTAGTTITITGTEVDGSTTNELQTIANTSDATSHTVTLSNLGGSTQLVEGSNITLTTTGTSGDGVVTIAASGGSTDLSISGSSSPLTINSSTGTDVTVTAGTGISLAGTSGNMTITNTAPSLWTDAGTDTYLTSTTDNVAIGATSAGSKLDIRTDALGVTQTNTSGLLLSNTTAAAAGAQQISPAIRWRGNGWKTNATAASQTVDFRVDVLPVQGAANPDGWWQLYSSVNGGTYGKRFRVKTDGTTDIGNYSSEGLQIVPGTTGTNTASIITGRLTLGTNGGITSGYGVRFQNNFSVSATGTSFQGVTGTVARTGTASGSVCVLGSSDFQGSTTTGKNYGTTFICGNNPGTTPTYGAGKLINVRLSTEETNYSGSSNWKGNGAAEYVSMLIDPIINQQAAATGAIYGIDYNPTLNNLLGANYAALFRSGNVGINSNTPTEKLEVGGNIALTTAGNKLKIATGSNASIGTSTLVAGTVTVSTTAVATGSHIVVCYDTPAGTLASGLSAPTASIVNATSFVINSLTTAGVVNTLDTSSVRWWIIN